MKFSREKKGYNREQVDEYIFNQKNEYESKLSEQKNRIFDLTAQLAQAQAQLAEYQQKERAIATALITATEKAEEMERAGQARYSQEIDELRAFHEKWMARYTMLMEKYPENAQLAVEQQFNDAVTAALNGDGTPLAELTEQFDRENERLMAEGGAPTATTDGGFNYAEAWNPQDDLDTIMRDLGLLGEDD